MRVVIWFCVPGPSSASTAPPTAQGNASHAVAACLSSQATHASQLLATLQAQPFYRAQAEAIRSLPPRAAVFGDVATLSSVPQPIRVALLAQGIRQLYRHQSLALRALRRCNRHPRLTRHVVMTTSTSSGKSLAYNIPVLSRMLSNPHTTALYMFPTKALAQDQLRALQELIDASPPLCAAAVAHTYDGDTPYHARRSVRDTANILFTNPDMLHASLLPHHQQWARFFGHLAFVVLDEAHTYVGVFGAHVALVLRRVLRIAAAYGARPQVVCCTATIANPVQHFRALVPASVFAHRWKVGTASSGWLVPRCGCSHIPTHHMCQACTVRASTWRDDGGACQCHCSDDGAVPSARGNSGRPQQTTAREPGCVCMGATASSATGSHPSTMVGGVGAHAHPRAVACQEGWGDAVTVITAHEDGSVAGRRTLVLWNPPPVEHTSPPPPPPPPPPPHQHQDQSRVRRSRRRRSARVRASAATTQHPTVTADSMPHSASGDDDHRHAGGGSKAHPSTGGGSGAPMPCLDASCATQPCGAAAAAAAAVAAPPRPAWHARWVSGDDPAYPRRHSAAMEAALITAAIVRAGRSCLLFCKTRMVSERLFMMVRRLLLEEPATEHLANLVKSYRGGYAPARRRGIEKALFHGHLRAVVCTNALELGIDVGSLDAVVMLGHPGKACNFWQQAGRAGRRRRDALVIMVAHNSPLDQYYARHPGAMFGGTPETAVVNLRNTNMIASHVVCAVAELPMCPADGATFFGCAATHVACARLASRRMITPVLSTPEETGRTPGVDQCQCRLSGATATDTHRGQRQRHLHPQCSDVVVGWNINRVCVTPPQPWDAVSLRAIGEQYKVVDVGNGGVEVDSLDARHAFFKVYEGAVYWNAGVKYIVEDLDLVHRLARVRASRCEYYTVQVRSGVVSRNGTPFRLCFASRTHQRASAT